MKTHHSTLVPKPTRFLAALAGAAALAAGPLRAQVTYNFSIYAGAGVTLDHTDGSGGNARFFSPVAAAVDPSSGNIFIADAGDHTIREMTTAGSVTTLAGASGQAGIADGTGSSARFVYPYAVAVANGNVYVADMGANNVRVVNISSGQVTTLAGSTSGASGSADGVGTAALFDAPEGIAVDAAGNVYVADTNNSTIRVINGTTDQVSTLAGSAGQTGAADGTAGSARFNFPGGLAVDGKGDLYVADYDNSTIRLVNTATGQVTTFAGSAGVTGAVNGGVTAARFDHPNGVAVDGAGNVYVADTSTQTIREISAGVVSTLAGSAYLGGRADGTGVAASFFYPNGLAVSAAGVVYVADTGNHRMRQIAGGAAVTTLAGATGTIGSADGGATSGATFNYPYGVAVDSSGNLYVADSNNDTIRMVSTGGVVTTIAGAAGVAGSADGTGGAARFNSPAGVAVDSTGRVYVADAGNSTIRMLVPSAGQYTVSTLAGTAGQTGASDGVGASARFNHPLGVAVDASGNVYVADTNNNTIRMIVPSSQAVTTIAGMAGQTGSGNGPGGGATFDAPYALAVDGSGNLYVADNSNDQIREVARSGASWNVSTLAGALGQTGIADGQGSAARFNQMYAIAADASGDVFVADTLNREIRSVTHGGLVTTINGSQSRFYYPQGLALDASGDLYVVDGDNQAISEGVPQLPTGSTQLGSHTVYAVGAGTTFTFGQPGAGLTYQWQVSTNGGTTWANVANGGIYSGATTTALAISSTTASMNGYQYRLVISSGGAASATGAGTLYVGAVRLVNLSTRGYVAGGGQNNLVVGFYISGSGSKEVLLRAVGPTLASFGVSGVLAQPTLALDNSSGAEIDSNTVWGGSQALANVFAQVGAFSLPATSADSALYVSLSANGNTSYTAQVSGVGNTQGIALAEIYDADTGTPATRLINISTRGYVGTGADAMTAGFVVSGSTSETILIRGIGPSLSQYGISSPLSNPVLTLYQESNGSSTVIGGNTVWGGTTALSDAMTEVGAFSIPPTSADSAMLVSLAPGTYTVQLSGSGNGTGVALIELYEVK